MDNASIYALEEARQVVTDLAEFLLAVQKNQCGDAHPLLAEIAFKLTAVAKDIQHFEIEEKIR